LNRKHRFFYRLLQPVVKLFAKIWFGYRCEVAKDLPENYIVLSNHTTDFDFLFVASSFPRQMYFVGSEHIARWKALYFFLKHLAAPIMRPKGSSAAGTVLEILRKVRQGNNVCFFPEGVRSWDGRLCPITPSTAKVVKSAGCALVTYRITGGYFVSPMWGGASIRRGPISGSVMNVYTKEQLEQMSREEVYRAILTDLGEDAYQRQLAQPQRYRNKQPAKGLEKLLFICPQCGSYETISTRGDTVSCKHCGMQMRYTEYGMLEGSPFRTVTQLSDWQRQQVANDVETGKVYTAKDCVLSTVSKHTEEVIGTGPVCMSKDTLICAGKEFDMSQISDLAMHGQRAIVFTSKQVYYELFPSEDATSLKFFLFFQELKNKSNVKVG